MDNFTFWSGTKIIFGKGTEKEVGKETKEHGSKVLLHYGGGSIKKTGLYDRVVKSLNDSGVDFIELSGVVPNPRLSLVKEGIELCRKERIDFILAVGGGSVIDSAKAIAAGIPYEGDVWDFYEGKKNPEDAIPLGVVLTIPAAGSEASPNTVITDEKSKRKLACGSDHLKPKFSILNPNLTLTLPPEQTAYGITDMFAHILERYFTNTKHVDVTDRMCEGVMRSIVKNARELMKDPDNYDLRAEIMFAGYVAHNNSLGIGREQDWATHRIEHELSAFYDIAHGAGLAVIFPAWMKFVCKHDVKRFSQWAEEVWGIKEGTDEKKAFSAIRELETFFKDIGLSVRIKDLGIDDEKFEEMADELMTTLGPVGNFVRIGKDECIEIFRIAYE